jgi:hypothetical protein
MVMGGAVMGSDCLLLEIVLEVGSAVNSHSVCVIRPTELSLYNGQNEYSAMCILPQLKKQ